MTDPTLPTFQAIFRLDHPFNRQARILRRAADRPVGFARLFAETRRFGRGHTREDEKQRTHVAVSNLCRFKALDHSPAGFRTTDLGRAALDEVDRRHGRTADEAASIQFPPPAAGRASGGDRQPDSNRENR